MDHKECVALEALSRKEEGFGALELFEVAPLCMFSFVGELSGVAAHGAPSLGGYELKLWIVGWIAV